VRLCVVSVLVVLELVLESLLLDADEELGDVLGEGLAPMLWVLLPALGVLLAPVLGVLLPALGVVLAPAPWVLLLPALPALGVLLPEVWAMARPTPPASAAAAASMVKLFLVVFISVLLDMEIP
jgi:hypothetical protein